MLNTLLIETKQGRKFFQRRADDFRRVALLTDAAATALAESYIASGEAVSATIIPFERYEVEIWSRGRKIRTEMFLREQDARGFYADRIRGCSAPGIRIIDHATNEVIEVYGEKHII